MFQYSNKIFFVLLVIGFTATNKSVLSNEAYFDLSNIAIEDPKDNKPSRVGFKFLEDGSKVRYSKRSGEVIDS